jgi:hypothetical protein
MTHDEAVNTLASERYLLGEMSVPEREAFEAHYFDCADCAEDVRVGSTMTEAVRAGLLEAPAVAPSSRARAAWLHAPALPWAIAAVLTLAVAYEAVPGRTGAGRIATPTALNPVTIRPAARGHEPSVAIGAGDAFATLAIDVTVSAPSRNLRYTLRPDGGSVVASAQVPVPQPGFPLLLLVPRRLLPRGSYVLVIRDSVNSNLTAAEYRFTVVAR